MKDVIRDETRSMARPSTRTGPEGAIKESFSSENTSRETHLL